VDDVRAVCAREREWVVAFVRALVSHESPSTDRNALDACGAFLAGRLAAAGASVTRLAAGSTTDHVLATWPGAGPRVLLVGHFDTVWPVGQLARMPLHESDGKLFGPGVLDMKGGLGIGTLAARALAEAVPDAQRPQISLIATSDEEVGSRTSREAIERLGTLGEVRAVSSFYDTEPVGYTAQPRFLNGALLLETELPPEKLIRALLAIERAMGRVRDAAAPKGPRVIDLDLLLYGDAVMNTEELTLPHPAIAEREFVLGPLTEIAPGMIHPVLGLTVSEMLDRLRTSSM